MWKSNQSCGGSPRSHKYRSRNPSATTWRRRTLLALHPYVSKRMSWAATRQTTRSEDKAYCLLGLFNVNMAMLYREGGQKAFHRLQEEIMKYSTDQTILAWSPQKQDWSKTLSVLADSPAAFHDGARILPFEQQEHFEMTSRGLRIGRRLFDSALVQPDCSEIPSGAKVVLLSCIYENDPTGQCGINIIQMEKEGPGIVFERVMRSPTMIPMVHLRARRYIHKRDLQLSVKRARVPEHGTSHDFRISVKERFEAVKSYLQMRDIDNVYISRTTIRNPTEVTADAYYFFPVIQTQGRRHRWKYSLLCPALGSDSAEKQSAKFGKIQQSIEVNLREVHSSPEPDKSICRIILSRSETDSSRLEMNEIQCQCGNDCSPFKSLGPEWLSLSCSVSRIYVSVSNKKEQLSGRVYNVIQFVVLAPEDFGSLCRF